MLTRMRRSGGRKSIARSVLKLSLYLVYLAVLTPCLLFALLEIPALNAWIAPDLRYYTLKRSYSPDSELVFVPASRGRSHHAAFTFRGDLYTEDTGVEVDPIEVDVTYEPSGFRTNSAAPPYDVVVIGDSFVELSESDDNTFSERLATFSRRAVLNRGTAWYGPYQYVELLRRLDTPSPRYALFMFYAGNDIEDIQQYERWREGADYYEQDRRYWEASIPGRFAIVAEQTYAALKRAVTSRVRPANPAPQPPPGETHPHVALVRLGETIVPMAMAARSSEAHRSVLLATEEWRTLARLVAEFRSISNQRGITPVVVYVPTKIQTYAQQISQESGAIIRAGLEAQRTFAGSEAEALAAVATGAGACFVDLLPVFQSTAAGGELLFHPFDTHWNENGRSVAARAVAEALGWSTDAPGLGQARCSAPARSPRSEGGSD